MTAAMTRAGPRNCHTETPAARATTSSWVRVRREMASIPPSSTVKGSAFWARVGNCKSAMPSTTPMVALGRLAARRNSSTRSKTRIRQAISTNTVPMLKR